ncbi:MAG: hypothetical protein ABIJ35_00155 [Acidobacteriota bacterium]|nr:hypothetical protein [Acidobacteriota bacterium]MBU4495428.1 hypothetical protein [Acidobacteriota bacterium]
MDGKSDFAGQAAEGLRNILRSFLTEAIKIRDTFPDEPERRREEIKKLRSDIDFFESLGLAVVPVINYTWAAGGNNNCLINIYE